MGVELGVAGYAVAAFCRVLFALWFVGSKTCIELDILEVKKKVVATVGFELSMFALQIRRAYQLCYFDLKIISFSEYKNSLIIFKRCFL